MKMTFNDLLPFISGLTENEASSFGRFLDTLLIQANKWNLYKDIYDKECYNFPGFHLKIGNKPTQDPLSYETYKQLTFKWQMRTLRCFLAALKNPKSEYIVIRNSFVILAKMVSSFPIIADHYSQLEECVLNLHKREKGKRDDLALLASSYAARLKSISKNVVDRSVYHSKGEKSKKVNKPGNNESTLTPENSEKRKAAEMTTPHDIRKRLRTDGNKENGESSDNKPNGTTKNSQDLPVKEDKSREDGEVIEGPPHKRLKSTSGKDEKAHEKPRDKEHIEKLEERSLKPKKREDDLEKKERREEKEQKEEKNHRENRHSSKKEEIEKKKDEAKDRNRAATPRRAHSERSEKRNESSSEAKEHPDGNRERKETKEDGDAKKRKEIVKESSNGSVNSKDERKEKSKREERKEDKRESDKGHKQHVETKKDAKKEERHQRIEKAESKEDKKESKEDKKDTREDKKESRELKKENRVEKTPSDRKRITIDRADKEEPGVKISRTLSGSKPSKIESKSAEPVRKHRAISPPRDTRRSLKDSRPTTRR